MNLTDGLEAGFCSPQGTVLREDLPIGLVLSLVFCLLERVHRMAVDWHQMALMIAFWNSSFKR